MFLLLSAIWGSSFLFIKTALGDGVPPLTLVSLRAVLGSIFLGLVMLAWGQRLPRGREVWVRFAFLGVVNTVVPFTLISWGQQYLPTGLAAVINAMVPLFTIVLASLVLHDEPITPARLGGLLIGFSGVVMLAMPRLSGADTDQASLMALLGILAVAAATLFYAIAGVFTRRQLNRRAIARAADGSLRPPTPLETALGSSLVAGVLATTLAVALERPPDGLLAVPSSGEGWLAVLWLGVLGTGLAYLFHFRILERWGPTRASLVTYVIPLVAVTLGFVVLGERLTPLELIGAALIIGGVVLVNSSVGQRPLFVRRTPQPRVGTGDGS
jgi:drug/metabolite transporter (DMT)-like permease